MLDANVLVSALLWTGPPNAILRAAEAGEVVIVASPALVEEVRDVLGRPKLAPRLAKLATSVAELMESLLADLEVIAEPTVEPVVARDPDDDIVVACAVAAGARYIVSGDGDLLDLERHRGIEIVTPREMLDKLPR